jgi:chondroitin AC lyase
MKKRILMPIILFLTFWLTGYTQSDISIIKERIVSELLEPEIDDAQIAKLVETITEDGSWPGINYENVFRTNYEHSQHINNLVLLSKGYRNPSSAFYKSEELKNSFFEAINFWNEHDFIADNWHTNEIANPRKWNMILFLMEEELSDEQTKALVKMSGRANFNSWGARPGGDQIKIAGIAAELAIFLDDKETLSTALEIMANEIQISSGNGIKPDLAFHHRVDRVTSILSYGTGYAEAFADWAVRLVGTKFNFPEETTKLVVDFYLDGICKSMVYAWYKDPGALNRGISREGTLQPVGPGIPRKLAEVSDYRKSELENIEKIRTGKQKPNLAGNKFFWHSEYQSHQRPEYFTSVRMFSVRNHNMEFPHNMESLKMHHYGDGSNFISRTGKEYYDIFSVWDWQKIPGTTVVQKDTLPSYREIVKWGKTSFVGGVTNGIYGAATFDFDSPHDDLKAHKSWFFFDEEYVCLGTGIQSDSKFPVATTINQCLLKGDVVVKSNSKNISPGKGQREIEEVSWVFHDEIAYIFPKPVDVSLANRTYIGKWQDISKQARALHKKQEQKELFSLWINHGKKPNNKSYEYIVRPAISVDQIEKYRKNSEIRVLLNNPDFQAVQHRGLNLTQIVFYKAGAVELSKNIQVSMNQPGIIMIKSAGTKIEEIAVADPTRNLDLFKLTISAEFNGTGKNWKSTWKKSEGISEIEVQLPQGGMAGKSVVLKANENETYKYVNRKKTAFEEPRQDGKHYIGEKYGGGVIIWLDETREHGLIAATSDQIASVTWKNGGARIPAHFGDANDRFINAKRDGIGAGEMNTQLIISQQTDDNFFGNFAAKVAVECKLGGYGDWYLPSKSELDIMFELKDEIGGFESNSYWSSTEYNVGFAWGLSFKHYKSEFTFNKGSRNAVRCVRKF